MLGTSRSPSSGIRPPAAWPSKLPIDGGTPHVGGQGKPVASSSYGPERTGVLHRRRDRSARPSHASEPTHGVIALFHATVILLQSIIEIAVGPMRDLTA